MIGIVAAMVSADHGQPYGPFPQIATFPGQFGFEWRYGFMNGALSINPNLTPDDFMVGFVNSFTDAPLAKEISTQFRALGAIFINGGAAVGDAGVFEAALETGFFTSGQDADMTNPDNPNIITTQLKYTGMATRMVVEEFFSDTGIIPGVFRMGLAEGGVGAAHITSPGAFRNYEVLTDEIIAAATAAWEDILAGRIVLDPVPLEDDFFANWPGAQSR